jgi:hypothetical protein
VRDLRGSAPSASSFLGPFVADFKALRTRAHIAWAARTCHFDYEELHPFGCSFDRMTRSLRWLLLGPLAIGCGYVGIEDLEQPTIPDHQTPGGSSGGKAGDGDGDGDSGDGDGDMSLGGAGDGSGGASSGAGGGENSSGGRESGAGGHEASAGGSEAGTGGAETGGSGPGSGGADLGTGGADSGAGGSNLGTGGAWEPQDEVWSNPNRAGCWPFCAVQFNPSFETHYLFEQEVVPAPGVESEGELYVSDEYFNWGVSSLGVHFGESPAYAYIPTDIDAGINDWIYVRAYVRIPSDTITGDVGLLDFVAGDVPVALIATHPGARLSAAAPLEPNRVLSTTGAYPFDEWFCLRAAVLSSDVGGSVTVEADGDIVAELFGVDTRGLVNIDTVSFGVTSTGPFVTGGDIYWDSIVIDHEPVACNDMTVPL